MVHSELKIILKPNFVESKSPYGPSLALFNNRLILGWVDTEGNINVRMSTEQEEHNRDVLSLGDPVTLKESAVSSPAIASYEGKIYIAWQNENNRICLTSSPNGTDWGSTIIMDEETSSPPALGLEKSDDFDQYFLLLGWRGKNGKLRFRRTQDFLKWWDTKSIDVDISGTPTISKYPESTEPDLFWQTDGTIYYSKLYSSGQYSNEHDYEFEVQPEKLIQSILGNHSVPTDSRLGLVDNTLAWVDSDTSKIRMTEFNEAPKEELEDQYEITQNTIMSTKAKAKGDIALERVDNYIFLAWTGKEDEKVRLARL